MRGRDAQGERCGEKLGASMLWMHSPLLVSMCSPTCKLSEPGPFGFLWRFHRKTCLVKLLTIGDWSWGQSWGAEAENSYLLIIRLVSLATSPSSIEGFHKLSCCRKGLVMNNWKIPVSPLLLWSYSKNWEARDSPEFEPELVWDTESDVILRNINHQQQTHHHLE